MRTVAFDGLNSLKIPDTQRNRCWIGRIWYRLAFAGYPTLRLMCLVETGTRGLLGAVIGGAIGTPGDRDEAHLARRLLGPGMLLLANRAFDSAAFLVDSALWCRRDGIPALPGDLRILRSAWVVPGARHSTGMFRSQFGCVLRGRRIGFTSRPGASLGAVDPRLCALLDLPARTGCAASAVVHLRSAL
jgi:hypothetical protein